MRSAARLTIQRRYHRSVHLIIDKDTDGFESRSEAYGFLIQMRLEKTQFVKRAICRVKKFAVVFFCTEDCDVHRLISAIGLATTTEVKLGSNCE